MFSGGFTLDAAEAVCMGGIVDSYSVLNLLSDLVDKSLVQTDDLSLETRYRLLETIRHYARNRLLEAGETDDVRSRHLAWFFSSRNERNPNWARRTGRHGWTDSTSSMKTFNPRSNGPRSPVTTKRFFAWSRL